jgi:integrase
VDAILNTTHAERISELSASAVQVCIGDMHDGGTSLQTCQHYLRAIKQFSRWLKRDGRVRDDALAHLTGYNAATDRRYERRALDAEELAQLIAAAEDGPPWRWSLSGTDRGMLYRVASGTGFRASELASLTPAGFDLDADQPTVMLRAATSKPRREDLQPIRTDLAELLRKWLADKPAEAPAWPGHWYDQGAEMVRSDLRRAKARWIREGASRAERRKRLDSDFLNAVDSSGQIVDFHALRTTYITMLVKGGASVKVAQQLARHSDPKLTLNVYTKLGSHDLASGLAGLPASPQQQPARKRKRATGS